MSFFLGGCSDDYGLDDESDLPYVNSVFAINGNRSVELGWAGLEGEGDLVEHLVFRLSTPEEKPSDSSLIATLPGTARRYVDTGLVNGRRYYYRIIPTVQIGGGTVFSGTSATAVPARPFDYSSVGTIVFSAHVQPILQSGCGVHGCHSGNITDHETDALRKILHGEKFRMREWEDLFMGGDHGAIVVPYRSIGSHLIKHINTDTAVAPVALPHMPLEGFVIPDDQRNVIMRWIDQGAPSDFGAVAFSTFPDGSIMATNQAEDVISIIDVRTRLVARYVRAGHARVVPPLQPQAPHNITVDRASGTYFVNLVSAGKVLKYRLSDNALLGEVQGILSPTQVAISSTGDSAFVSQFSQNSNAIRMFNPRTMTMYDETIGSPLISKPHGIEISPDGRQLVITGNFSNNLLVVDLDDLNQRIVWLDPNAPVPGTNLKPYQTVMTSDNKRIYVTCQGSDEVRVVSRDSLKLIAAIPVGGFPLIPAITPDDRFLFVPNRNSNNISIIDLSTNTVVETMEDVGSQPHAIAFDKAGRYAYVTCENSGAGGIPPHHPVAGSKLPGFIVVIDVVNRAVVETIEVGNFAAGIAVVE